MRHHKEDHSGNNGVTGDIPHGLLRVFTPPQILERQDESRRTESNLCCGFSPIHYKVFTIIASLINGNAATLTTLKREIRPILMGKIGEDKIEKETQLQQKFSIAGAIGRAGKGLLKGASPVSPQDQVLKMLEEWVDQNSSDPSGAFKSLLKQNIRSSRPLVERHRDRPKDALARVIEDILSTEFMLREFVRQVDVRWGEMFQARPFFQKEEQEPHPEDEYTFDSVRVELTQLLSKLKKP